MRGIRRPETVRINLSGGHWLLVKKHLNAGEERRIYAHAMIGQALVQGEKPRLDPEAVGVTQIVEYLLDWSITDPDGKVVPVRDVSDTAKSAAVLQLDPEDFAEVMLAIQKHDADMTAEREAEKNGQAGATTSSATLESVA